MQLVDLEAESSARTLLNQSPNHSPTASRAVNSASPSGSSGVGRSDVRMHVIGVRPIASMKSPPVRRPRTAPTHDLHVLLRHRPRSISLQARHVFAIISDCRLHVGADLVDSLPARGYSFSPRTCRMKSSMPDRHPSIRPRWRPDAAAQRRPGARRLDNVDGWVRRGQCPVASGRRRTRAVPPLACGANRVRYCPKAPPLPGPRRPWIEGTDRRRRAVDPSSSKVRDRPRSRSSSSTPPSSAPGAGRLGGVRTRLPVDVGTRGHGRVGRCRHETRPAPSTLVPRSASSERCIETGARELDVRWAAATPAAKSPRLGASYAARSFPALRLRHRPRSISLHAMTREQRPCPGAIRSRWSVAAEETPLGRGTSSAARRAA